MAGSTLNPEHAAMVLCDALFYGDAKAAERAGITTRTLRRYRERMASSPKLSAIVRLKKDELCSRWADDLAVGIRSACDFIRRSCAEGDVKNPDMLRSVNGSLKIMADAQLAERIVGERTQPRAAQGGVVLLPPEGEGDDERSWH